MKSQNETGRVGRSGSLGDYRNRIEQVGWRGKDTVGQGFIDSISFRRRSYIVKAIIWSRVLPHFIGV